MLNYMQDLRDITFLKDHLIWISPEEIY